MNEGVKGAYCWLVDKTNKTIRLADSIRELRDHALEGDPSTIYHIYIYKGHPLFQKVDEDFFGTPDQIVAVLEDLIKEEEWYNLADNIICDLSMV